jgi:hypothetical protein
MVKIELFPLYVLPEVCQSIWTDVSFKEIFPPNEIFFLEYLF